MTMDATHLAAAGAELRKCPGCGQCRFVCPIFEELGDESSVARGRISLARALQSGEYPPTEEMAKRISECLLCLACVEECPSQVKVNEVVLAARADLADALGAGTVEKMAAAIFAHSDGWLAHLTPLAVTLERLVARRIPDQAALRLRFALGPLAAGRPLPQIAGRPLRNRLPARVSTAQNTRGTVAYFTGCLDNYTDVQVGLDAVSVLSRNGFDVLLPPDQACCGLPMLAYGLRESALPLIKQNTEALLATGAGIIVATCATCGGALRSLYHTIAEEAGDSELAEKTSVLAGRVKDITEFLADAGLTAQMRPVETRVTYHDPCHLAREQGVRAQPRSLLKSIPGLELVEMAEADRCCGGAGSFGFTHHELSQRVNDRKAAGIRATGAQVVATGCPSCKLYIAGGLDQNGVRARVVHTVQLLAQATEGE